MSGTAVHCCCTTATRSAGQEMYPLLSESTSKGATLCQITLTSYIKEQVRWISQ